MIQREAHGNRPAPGVTGHNHLVYAALIEEGGDEARFGLRAPASVRALRNVPPPPPPPAPADPARSPAGLTMLHAGPSADRANWPKPRAAPVPEYRPQGPVSRKCRARARHRLELADRFGRGCFQQRIGQTAWQGSAQRWRSRQMTARRERKLERTACQLVFEACTGLTGLHMPGVNTQCLFIRSERRAWFTRPFQRPAQKRVGIEAARGSSETVFGQRIEREIPLAARYRQLGRGKPAFVKFRLQTAQMGVLAFPPSPGHSLPGRVRHGPATTGRWLRPIAAIASGPLRQSPRLPVRTGPQRDPTDAAPAAHSMDTGRALSSSSPRGMRSMPGGIIASTRDRAASSAVMAHEDSGHDAHGKHALRPLPSSAFPSELRRAIRPALPAPHGRRAPNGSTASISRRQ